MFINSLKKYRSGFTKIKNLSNKTGLPPEQVAEMVLIEKRPEVEKFVKASGMKPAQNIRSLAGQVVLAHAKRVNDLAKVKNVDVDEAEKQIFSLAEYRSYTGGGNDVDNFAPVLLATAVSLGGPLISGINDKRKASGKKPILSGKFWQSLKGATQGLNLSPMGETGLNIGIEGRPSTGPRTELGAGLESLTAEIERQKKKEFLKKNLIWIILGVVGFGVLIYFIAKKK
jgi:hypothetical protein